MPDKYVVYSIRNAFSGPPPDINRCPICATLLSISDVKPSKHVSNDVSDPQFGSIHLFSHLLECEECHWWAVRESWTNYEYGHTFDFLITGTTVKETECHASVWSQAMEEDDIYQKVMPLPEKLIQRFAGGRK
jgi:hypothetical protein